MNSLLPQLDFPQSLPSPNWVKLLLREACRYGPPISSTPVRSGKQPAQSSSLKRLGRTLDGEPSFLVEQALAGLRWAPTRSTIHSARGVG